MFANFCITFFLYPGILIQKDLALFTNGSWNFFLYTITYSLGDFAGRFSPNKFAPSFSRSFLLIGFGLRFILVGTSFFIAFYDSPFWNNAAVSLINCTLVGYTGGFITVASGSSFPGRLEDSDKEFGGFLMSVMINLGIGIGSLISLLGFQN